MEDVDTKDALGALVQAVETNTIVIEHDLTEAVNSALESADDQDQDLGDGNMEDMDQEDDQDQQDQQDEQDDQRDQMQQDNDAHNESSETPAKNKNYSRYDAGRKYREVWQEIHPWVSRAVPDEEFAYCAACRRTFRPRITALAAHEKSAKHIENWRRFRIEQQLMDEALEEADVENKLAMAAEESASYVAVDGESVLTIPDTIQTPRPTKKIIQTIGTQNAMIAPMSIKRERLDDDPKTEMENLALNSSVEAIMEAVGPKVFDKLSIWEIILHKATQSQDFNAMDLVIKDVENILMEMKLLMNNCFDHVELTRRRQREIINQQKVGVNISKFLANAIEVESGFWNQRDPDDVTYRNGLEVGLLIPMVMSYPSHELEDIKTNIKVKSKTRSRGRDPLDDPEYVARRRAPGKRIKHTKCPKCGKDYGPGENNKTHMPSCPASLKYKKVGALMYCCYDNCPNPEQEYKLREDILKHFDEHHFTDEARTTPCTYEGCTQMFATVTLRNIHIRKNHEKLYACDQCPKRFWSEKNLNDHIKNGHTLKESGEAPAKAVELCRKCGKMMIRTSLSKHESRCTGYACRNPQWKEVNGEFFCTVRDCHIKHGFSGMYGLRVHFFNSHLDETEKQFECEHCGKKYADRIMFRKHVKAVHVKPYVCNLCTGRFGNKSQLAEHMNIHTGNKPHACDKCDFRCAKKFNLIDHKQKKHNDLAGRNYHCGICGKVFLTSGRLTSHFRIIHQDGLVEGTPKKKNVKRGKSMPKIVLVDGKEKNMTGQAEQDIAVDFLMNQDQADFM